MMKIMIMMISLVHSPVHIDLVQALQYLMTVTTGAGSDGAAGHVPPKLTEGRQYAQLWSYAPECSYFSSLVLANQTSQILCGNKSVTDKRDVINAVVTCEIKLFQTYFYITALKVLSKLYS